MPSTKFFSKAFALCVIGLLPLVAAADQYNPACTGTSCEVRNPLNVANFPDLINAVLRGVLIIAVPIIVLFIVYAGFLFVTARGNTEQLAKARTNLLWVVVGAVVLIGASAIAAIIANTLRAFGVGT